MSDTDKSELEKQIRDIIKAPMRSQISTADIAVNMMSSTGLSEKIHALSALITQQCNQARRDERKFLERLKIEFDANVSMEAGEKWSESDAAIMVSERLAELQAQAKEQS